MTPSTETKTPNASTNRPMGSIFAPTVPMSVDVPRSTIKNCGVTAPNMNQSCPGGAP